MLENEHQSTRSHDLHCEGKTTSLHIRNQKVFKTVWPYDENTVKYRWSNGILMGNSHRHILTRTLVLGFWLWTGHICFISFFLEILKPRQCSGSVGNHSESNRRYKPLGRVIV